MAKIQLRAGNDRPMKRILYAVLIPFMSFHGNAISCDEKGNWVTVDASEIMKHDWRRHSETGFGVVQLDMNGDGLDDRASLVVSQDGARSAIKICFGSKDGDVDVDCRILAEGENIYPVMGLEKRSPGCYEFHEDDAGNTSDGRICSKFDALEYFRFGSSSSFFIYDENGDSFGKYWDSY